MPKTIFVGMGEIPYSVFTYAEMKEKDIDLNPNMYIGNGYMFCAKCNKYTYHFALSPRAGSECFELCKECDSYVIPRANAIRKGLIK